MAYLDEASSLANICDISDCYITSLKSNVWTKLDYFVPLISIFRILLVLFLELDSCSLRSGVLPEAFVDYGLAAAHLNFAIFVSIDYPSDEDILLLDIAENIPYKLVGNLTHLEETVSLGVDLNGHTFPFDAVDITYSN